MSLDRHSRPSCRDRIYDIQKKEEGLTKMKKIVFGVLFGLFFFSSQAFAHGTAEEHQVETGTNMYFFTIGMIVIFILFLTLHYAASSKVKNLTNVKKQVDREKRLKLTKWAKGFKWLWIVSLLGVIILGGMSLLGKGTKGADIVLQHIHGLGYSKDGEKIL
jgi:heme/copper-type cytochrome/quinol oxidase subunit 2